MLTTPTNLQLSKNLKINGTPGEANQTASYIAFAAGKSGGHIVPCLTLAQEYKLKNNKTTVAFFTTDLPLDRKIVNQSKVVDTHIPLSLKKQPSNLWELPQGIYTFCYSFLQCFNSFWYKKPDFVVSTGGIIALPVTLVAHLFRVPIYLYELNATPGTAIKTLSSFATAVYYCFDELKHHFPKKRLIRQAYPIRYTQRELKKSAQAARTTLGLDENKKTIAILGGSQGSTFINSIIKVWIEKNPDLVKKVQLIHQIGQYDIDTWHRFYADHHAHVKLFDYKSNLSDVYAAADIIICRSGAGTVFEAKAFNRPCLLIPLETAATDHQLDNAKEMIKKYPHIFTMLRQENIKEDEGLFFKTLNSILF